MNTSKNFNLDAFRVSEDDEHVDYHFSAQVRAEYAKGTGNLWLRWSPSPRPCFNTALLEALLTFIDALQCSRGRVAGEAVRNIVIASDVARTFSLGGDLAYFIRLIEAQDRVALQHYGDMCVQCTHALYNGFGLPLLTYALLEGDALGGGFEAALACDVRVAERHVKVGCPERAFGLFAGMGAASLLERRVGAARAEELLLSGCTPKAEALEGRGLIDVLAEAGEGAATLEALLEARRPNHTLLTAQVLVRRRVQRLELDELLQVVELWVEKALDLPLDELQTMHTLVRLQDRKYRRRDIV